MSDKEIEYFLKNGLLVFDTNVLLNLYFYTAETKNKMLGVMEKCKDRLWLPYQVGWEFFNNRKDKIEMLHNSCNVISNNVNEAKIRFSKLLNDNYQRHPYIVRKELIDLFNNSLKPVEDKLKELKKNDPDYGKKDTIWATLEKLYEGKVGEDYSLEKLKSIYKEGEERYSFSIPPGYADKKKKEGKGPRHLYGDVIIWEMVIDHAKEKNLDVVFVTEEKKEDWFENKREPRKDLLKEFFDRSGGRKVLICGQEEFLYLTDIHLGTEVGKDAIKEIKEVADEERKREEVNLWDANNWNKSLDPSIFSLGVNGRSIWRDGLTPEAYSGVTGIPLSTVGSYLRESGITSSPLEQLYDTKTGLTNPFFSLEDYLAPKPSDASGWETFVASKLLGRKTEPTDSILGILNKDEPENKEYGKKKGKK